MKIGLDSLFFSFLTVPQSPLATSLPTCPQAMPLKIIFFFLPFSLCRRASPPLLSSNHASPARARSAPRVSPSSLKTRCLATHKSMVTASTPSRRARPITTPHIVRKPAAMPARKSRCDVTPNTACKSYNARYRTTTPPRHYLNVTRESCHNTSDDNRDDEPDCDRNDGSEDNRDHDHDRTVRGMAMAYFDCILLFFDYTFIICLQSMHGLMHGLIARLPPNIRVIVTLFMTFRTCCCASE
ncbi:hypothetical protein EDB83DRAFT_2436863 [Lactarius deliciosus]|nr:hypothetical protein EDB83DRAFT_2436863 [Lactarius deliciosus]